MREPTVRVCEVNTIRAYPPTFSCDAVTFSKMLKDDAVKCVPLSEEKRRGFAWHHKHAPIL